MLDGGLIVLYNSIHCAKLLETKSLYFERGVSND